MLRLLERVAASNDPVTVAQIATRLDIPKASATRLAQMLIATNGGAQIGLATLTATARRNCCGSSIPGSDSFTTTTSVTTGDIPPSSRSSSSKTRRWAARGSSMALSRAVPPEDVGDTLGYEQFLETIRDDPDSQEARELLAPGGRSVRPAHGQMQRYCARPGTAGARSNAAVKTSLIPRTLCQHYAGFSPQSFH